MHIPIDKLEIATEKLTGYLLVQKQKNDKSTFLAKLGYTIENWNELLHDIKSLVAANEATLQNKTPFGDLYEVKGNLKGFGIVTIWLLAIDSEKYKFITLFPQ